MVVFNASFTGGPTVDLCLVMCDGGVALRDIFRLAGLRLSDLTHGSMNGEAIINSKQTPPVH